MYVVTVTFHLQPDHADAFAARVTRQAEDSVALEPDCHRFDVCRDPGEPAVYFLYELYRDADAFQAHLATPHFRAFDNEVRDWLASKQVHCFDLTTSVSG